MYIFTCADWMTLKMDLSMATTHIKYHQVFQASQSIDAADGRVNCSTSDNVACDIDRGLAFFSSEGRRKMAGWRTSLAAG